MLRRRLALLIDPTLADKRATMTLLPDGQVILGLPPDMTMAVAHEVARGVREWIDRGMKPPALIFPFPITVDDQR